MNKLTKAEKARTDQGLERQKKMWIARGEIIFSDDVFKSLTDEQRNCIIDLGVVGEDYGKWTIYKWWDGMAITERKNAFIRLMKQNA